MNKFKFGDKVWHDIEPVGFGVVISTENGESYVAFKSGTMDWFSDAELTHVSEWIKCSERMPEDGDSVLVIDLDRNIITQASLFECNFYPDAMDFCIDYDDRLNVTHGMPLPAPPQD